MLFVKFPEIEFEFPEEAIPVRFIVLFLVQVKTVLVTPFGFAITIGMIASPEHIF